MKKLLGFIAAIFIVWIIVSFFDVITHNLTNQEYLEFNAFKVFMEVIDNV